MLKGLTRIVWLLSPLSVSCLVSLDSISLIIFIRRHHIAIDTTLRLDQLPDYVFSSRSWIIPAFF